MTRMVVYIYCIQIREEGSPSYEHNKLCGFNRVVPDYFVNASDVSSNTPMASWPSQSPLDSLLTISSSPLFTSISPLSTRAPPDIGNMTLTYEATLIYFKTDTSVAGRGFKIAFSRNSQDGERTEG